MNNFSLRKFILPVIFILVVAGGIFFYFKTQESAKTTPANTASTDSLPVGVSQAQKEAKDYSELVKKTSIQQSIEGVISTITNTTLTIESNGQSLQLLNEGSKTVYAKLPKDASSSSKPVTAVPIKAEEVKVGDKVLVIRNLDSETGSSTIVAVTVLP